MIGVVGDGPPADAVASAARACGADVVAGVAGDVLAADPERLVAVGESALSTLVRAGVDAPVLPVDAGDGVGSVPGDAVEPAVERFVSDDWTPDERPVLDVAIDDREARALYDAMLVTTDPVSISEYSVRVGDDTTVAQFRADGVVVATPAGSHGYAHAAGGPVLGPDTDAVAVVPVAPFTTDRSHWVLDPPVTLAVEREETPVSLLVDGDDRGEVPAGESVALRWGGTVTLASVPEGRPFFE